MPRTETKTVAPASKHERPQTASSETAPPDSSELTAPMSSYQIDQWSRTWAKVLANAERRMQAAENEAAG